MKVLLVMFWFFFMPVESSDSSKQRLLNEITLDLAEKGVKCLVYYQDHSGFPFRLKLPVVNIRIDKIRYFMIKKKHISEILILRKEMHKLAINPECSWHIIDLETAQDIFQFLDHFEKSLPKSDHYFFIMKTGRILDNKESVHLFGHTFFKKVTVTNQ